MSFATVIARSGGHNSAATSHPITLPDGAEAGDLYVIAGGICNRFSTVSISTPGWTLIHADAFGVWLGIVGTATTPVTMTSSGSYPSSHNTWVIRDWGGVIENIASATAAFSSSAGPIDPPALTPSAGAADYLWICGGTEQDGSKIPPSAPSGWGNLAYNTTGSGGNGNSSITCSAELSVNAATENPDSFPLPSGQGGVNWAAFTLAIPYGVINTYNPANMLPFFM